MTNLKLSEFDYHLPKELIAQYPCRERAQSRLLLLDRRTGVEGDSFFYQLPDFLRVGDVLVLNRSRVFPARLYGRKETGGKTEVLFWRELADNQWQAILRSAPPAGSKIFFNHETYQAEVVEKKADGSGIIRFPKDNDVRRLIAQSGQIPLPPYIERSADQVDQQQYQTVYAREEGSVAAPTAGLHFTRQLLGDLEEKGIEIVSLLLHVGPGTFLPVRSEEISDHRPLPEYYCLEEAAAEKLNLARRQNRRIIAVGTTVTRVLESLVDRQGEIKAGEGFTELFIYPGFYFRVVNCLITNFHLPSSTLLMLVSAFAGKENIFSAYRLAIEKKYRFYSYGDAMYIF
ncbi:MAG: tRNA preQ1(34) S-adenosylmethionine ribosyltransferase-isomerase QueA [Elusimicrobiota bacterium]